MNVWTAFNWLRMESYELLYDHSDKFLDFMEVENFSSNWKTINYFMKIL
jgi:hypothetical protein